MNRPPVFVDVRYIQLTPEGLFFSIPYIILGIIHAFIWEVIGPQQGMIFASTPRYSSET